MFILFDENKTKGITLVKNNFEAKNHNNDFNILIIQKCHKYKSSLSKFFAVLHEMLMIQGKR